MDSNIAYQSSGDEELESYIPDFNFRILIDARKIWDGGIGVYTRNLISGLTEYTDADVTIIVPKKIAQDKKFQNYPWLNKVKVIENNTKLYSLDEIFKLGKLITLKQYDLFHTPHYILPFGIKIPSVVTIHDLIHVRYPEKFYYPFFAIPLIASALKRATKVLTVSQSTLSELKKIYPVPNIDKKVSVVPNAIDPAFLIPCTSHADYLLNKFHITAPFFLSVFSTLKPHKGMNDLLKAFISIKEKANSFGNANSKVCNDFKLVLVGQGIESLANMSHLLNKVQNVKDVLILGKVNDEDLLNLYAGASALVVPSLAEGFGLPVIEAQAQGTPVITRPIPSVLEMLSKHDISCSDFSLEALENSLTTFIERYSCGEYIDPLYDVADQMKRFNLFSITKQITTTYKEAIDNHTKKK